MADPDAERRRQEEQRRAALLRHMRELVREPIYASDDTRLEWLRREFQRRRVHIAIILGPGHTSHVRVPGLASPVVLNLRNGLLRPSAQAMVGDRPLGAAEGIPVGTPVTAGGASFVISRV